MERVLCKVDSYFYIAKSQNIFSLPMNKRLLQMFTIIKSFLSTGYYQVLNAVSH
jgi:hypothetical protein